MKRKPELKLDVNAKQTNALIKRVAKEMAESGGKPTIRRVPRRYGYSLRSLCLEVWSTKNC
jgi:hypothetical protein